MRNVGQKVHLIRLIKPLKTRVDFNKIFKIEMFRIPEVSYHWGSVKLTLVLEQRTEPFVKSFK